MQDPVKKRLLYQSLHRGTKEADILIGGFARHALPHADEGFLTQFEELLQLPDQDLMPWIMGYQAIPEDLNNDALLQLKAYYEERDK